MTASGGNATRAEHLAWCKQRAQERVDRGELGLSLVTFIGDLGKHRATARSKAPMIAMQMLLVGRLRSAEEMRSFVEPSGPPDIESVT